MKNKLWKHQVVAIEKILSAVKNQSENKFHVVKIPTGGGKTRVGAECIIKLLENPDTFNLGKKPSCLWLAPNSNLLLQAAEELIGSSIISSDQMGHVGSKNISNRKVLLRSIKSISSEQKILFSTFATFMKSPERFKKNFPKIIVVDEVHYAEFSPTQEKLRKKFAGSQGGIFLGFTATPHNDSIYGKPIFEISMSDLVDVGVLAEPKKFLPTFIQESSLRKDLQKTLSWRSEAEDEQLERTNTDVTLSSLAKDLHRNQIIARTIAERRDLLGKTIVFAIDQEHCEILQKCIREQRIYGQESAIVTCHEANPDKIMDDFRNNREGYKVLITVRKAIHGYDVPDLKSVVIARPTKSAKLHRQMIGRAARGNNGNKKFFYVLDFFDSFNLLNEDFGSFGTYSPSSDDNRNRRDYYNRELIKDFSFDLNQRLTDEFSVSGPDRLAQSYLLPLRKRQQFGFEIELAIGKDEEEVSDSEWRANAITLRDAMYNQLGSKFVRKKIIREKDESGKYDQWKVVSDSTCGWEIVSRILEGKPGVTELDDLLKCIRPFCNDSKEVSYSDGFFKVDNRTGLHLNLAYKFIDADHLKRFLHLVRYMEPAISSIISPSRVCDFFDGKYHANQPNIHATSLRWAFSKSDIEDAVGARGKLDLDILLKAASKRRHLDLDSHKDMKYFSINLLKIAKKFPAVEIRVHNGSWEFSKMGIWLSLWMFLMFKSEEADLNKKIDIFCDRKMPLPSDLESDDLCFVLSEKLNAPLPLIQAIAERRLNKSLLDSWGKVSGVNVKRNVDAWEARMKATIKKRTA